ncbi:MAG: UDP-N-acetylmuramoyl-L-alanine--D-glutamate ligase [Candidatus Hydrothermales bacterium]
MKVAIWGFGSSGKSVYSFMTKEGYKPFIIDKKLENEHLIPLFDKIVLSPGIPLNSVKLKNLIEDEKTIIPELEFGYKLIRGEIVAITGTNGKTTTSYLVYSILKEFFKDKKVYLCGNVGKPITDLYLREGIFVMEVSSFQLQFIKRFKPNIACILNISEDHLDSHSSFEEYKEAKLKIFKNMDGNGILIINQDDENLKDIKATSVKTLRVSLYEKVRGVYYSKDKFVISLDNIEEKIEDRFEKFIGEGNRYNIAFAILVSFLLGVDKENIINALSKLEPLPHRLEPVKKEDDILWINDSKSTNPHSVLYALKSFNSKNIILILGGKNKNISFRIIKEEVKNKVKKIILYGEAKDFLESDLGGIKEMFKVNTVREAVIKAKEVAERGDIILFSPGLSSFDQYKNYAQRGEDFKKWVREI